ncbi:MULTISPECIES: hypothetical protein [unclassified Cryobacterium]|uniref:hypothetical protein n=1 Tax=unclassified Cryobacterium TaxID=2649013 RepID=UPI002AB5446D|nr:MULTISPECIES: hypothetical protein [unclassified Cryobacterium]MDY7542624.1 hypothetical protein [Cryobacterium sp. 5B3]MEB0264744.1 hypothetical protein [Cryobacterium sp. 10I5]MEB0273716.1 hypothetical protein [Cryobacterium sp. 5B3]
MQTIYYSGTNFRVADELAWSIQSLISKLQAAGGSGFYSIPGYAEGSDNPSILRVRFMGNAPIVFAESFPSLPNAAGTLEAIAEIAERVSELTTSR